MWRDLINGADIKTFMNEVQDLHDSCLKEMRYFSGAYVDESLSMYPINSQRRLNVLIQLQLETMRSLELEFDGLKYLRLNPVPDDHTCEIHDSTILLANDSVFWCDQGGISLSDLDNYDGTVICASKLRWRPVCKMIGKEEVYVSSV